ncbi:helix-turn-helix domain-containing protein [Phycicoccus sp. BSK3Z-2]|uniref:Helix-turn-helix domain-containing protein n=1 Tax=Phycicoccus avicenniae TaxID=2828860 RepID=A0A941D8F1_9MICO|nr:helix-turn-helix domain-containing protein [Phycicoccus avicenniae]MBR7743758.1 helix-turn-helix domain-containing protein [Phycicoccus avicenniae]
MDRRQLSVVDAAALLGVHPQRIHQRIRSGSLPAMRIGRQWVVEEGDVRRLRRHRDPGRPLSEKSAWDLLAVAADDVPSVAALSPSSRSRARSRLRELVAGVASAPIEEAVPRIERALGRRSVRALFAASPRDLPELRGDPRIAPSGLSSSEADLSSGDVVEGYVSSADLAGVVDDHLLERADRARAGVVLHVVAAERAEAVDLARYARSPLAVAAALAEHDDVRAHDATVRLVESLAAGREAFDEDSRHA